MKAIEVKDLSFAFEQFFVLENVSFEVLPGEFIGVIGPNGGGKTTLLKLLMGFLEPVKGTIKLFNQSPSTYVHDEHKLSYVPQVMRFDKQFPISVMEVVLSGLLFQLPWHGRVSNELKKKVMMTLEQLEIEHLANQTFGELSGGQAQRVLIARAIVSSPELLFLDEPTANVDQNAADEIYQLLHQLKGKMTIVMVTHALKAALDYVDRLLIVEREVSSYKVEEVCEHFAMGLYHTPFVQHTIEFPSRNKKGDLP